MFWFKVAQILLKIHAQVYSLNAPKVRRKYKISNYLVFSNILKMVIEEDNIIDWNGQKEKQYEWNMQSKVESVSLSSSIIKYFKPETFPFLGWQMVCEENCWNFRRSVYRYTHATSKNILIKQNHNLFTILINSPVHIQKIFM